MKINTFYSAPKFHSYDTPASTDAPKTLQERCENVVHQMMVTNNLHAGYIGKYLSLPTTHPLKSMPTTTFIKEDDFPISNVRLNEIKTANSNFIVIEDGAIFSKEAFLFAYSWKESKGTTPTYADFCLIDSGSPYHRHHERKFLAPAVIVEMVDKETPRDRYEDCTMKLNADVYEKLVSLFCTLEVEKLIDLIAANHSSLLHINFPKAWRLLKTFLPKSEYGESRLVDLIKEWLLKESSATLASKIDRLMGGYKARYEHDDPIFGMLDRLVKGINIKYFSVSMGFYVYVNNPKNIFMLKDVQIKHLNISCSLTCEEIQLLVTPSLCKIYLTKHSDLTKETLSYIRSLPIKGMDLEDKTDEFLDYVSPTVESLNLSDVSSTGLRKVQNLALKHLTIKNTDKLWVSDFNLLSHHRLKSLTLDEVNVNSSVLEYINTSRLQSLTLKGKSDDWQIFGNLSDGISYLHNSPVERINIWYMKISEKALLTMAQMPKLSCISLFGCTMKRRDLNVLGKSKTLKRIWLDDAPISDKQIKKFKEKGITADGCNEIRGDRMELKEFDIDVARELYRERADLDNFPIEPEMKQDSYGAVDMLIASAGVVAMMAFNKYVLK